MIFFKQTVKCDGCKLLLEKEDAQAISVQVNNFFDDYTHIKYYCPQHRKPWDREAVGYLCDTRRFKEIVVELDGTPVGYKKITK